LSEVKKFFAVVFAKPQVPVNSWFSGKIVMAHDFGIKEYVVLCG